MKKRQALKILKQCRNVLFKDDSVLGNRYWRALKHRNKQIYRDIKRQMKITFSKPEWQNLTVEGPIEGCKPRDVQKDLAALNDLWEKKMYRCFEQSHLKGLVVD